MKNRHTLPFNLGALLICILSVSKALWVHNGALIRRQEKSETRRFVASEEASRKFFAADDAIVASDSLLAIKDVLKFYRDGHLQAKGLFDSNFIQNVLAPSLKEYYESHKLSALRIKTKVTLGREDSDEMTLEECETALQNVDPEDIPFMNVFNCWIGNEEAQKIVLSPKLGQIVAELLGVPAVRVYQDALFVKRSGDGPTRWHSDLNMAPFDTNDFLTCWIPLQSVPAQSEGGSSLSFATASHRDFALPYWSDPCDAELSERYEEAEYDQFEVGDCSFHHGWCLHSAPGNDLPDTRYALSIMFVADGAPLLQEEGHLRYPDNEDYQSYAAWIDEVGWGGYAEHPLLPLVFSEEEEINMMGGTLE